MNFNQLYSINYGNTQQKRFFEHLQELRSLLEDKYKLLSMPFSFRFCLYKYHPSCPTTRDWLPPDINKSMSNSKWPIFTTGRLLFQYSTDTAVESYRSDTAR